MSCIGQCRAHRQHRGFSIIWNLIPFSCIWQQKLGTIYKFKHSLKKKKLGTRVFYFSGQWKILRKNEKNIYLKNLRTWIKYKHKKSKEKYRAHGRRRHDILAKVTIHYWMINIRTLCSPAFAAGWGADQNKLIPWLACSD